MEEGKWYRGEKKYFLQLSELIYGFLAGEINFRQFFPPMSGIPKLFASELLNSYDMCFTLSNADGDQNKNVMKKMLWIHLLFGLLKLIFFLIEFQL